MRSFWVGHAVRCEYDVMWLGVGMAYMVGDIAQGVRG
jgi:hypothetical protein